MCVLIGTLVSSWANGARKSTVHFASKQSREIVTKRIKLKSNNKKRKCATNNKDLKIKNKTNATV